MQSVSFEAALQASQTLIDFMKQRSFITPEEIDQQCQLHAQIKEAFKAETQLANQKLSRRLLDSQICKLHLASSQLSVGDVCFQY